MKRFVELGCLALALALAAPVSAQDAVTLGGEAFNTHCAVCHGADGKGGGEVGALFAQRPKNLTLLSKENGGIFPFERVYQSIDGRAKVVAHGVGASPMPIWGDYLMADAMQAKGTDPNAAAMLVQGRVLTLVAYIQSIQQK